jgi:tetratricopeptide (TPR) repeat protein
MNVYWFGGLFLLLATGLARPAQAQNPAYARLLERAFEKHKIGDNQSAIEAFNQAIALDSTQPNAYYNRAVAYAAMGNTTRALADYTKVIKLNPKDGDAYYLSLIHI